MPRRVLVADDSVTIQKVVSLTFADEDVVIEAVADGSLALAKVRELKPDLVLADIFMPGQNGYQVCESIKRDPECANIPVVLLVGTFEPFDESEASRVRCDAYLTKPFDTSELIGIFNSLTGEGAAQSKGKSKEMSHDDTASPAEAKQVSETSMVSPQTRDSFLGDGKILDIFDADLLGWIAAQRRTERPAHEDSKPETKAGTPPESESHAGETGVDTGATNRGSEPSTSQVIPFPGVKEISYGPTPAGLTEEVMDAIVERVVRRMSQEVVREIAWEVVPELSEILIRQCLSDRGLAGKK